MFGWLGILNLLLQAASALFGWLRDRQLIKAGNDAAVAKAALEILEKTQQGKELREHIQSLEDAEADALWDRMLKQEKPK